MLNPSAGYRRQCTAVKVREPFAPLIGVAIGIGIGIGVGIGVAIGFAIAIGVGIAIGIGVGIGFGIEFGIEVEPHSPTAPPGEQRPAHERSLAQVRRKQPA
jgi:hypothetical protein